MRKLLTTNEVLKLTGIQYYTLNHLVRSGQITTVCQFGKGIQRQYDPSVIQEIRKILEKRGLASPINLGDQEQVKKPV